MRIPVHFNGINDATEFVVMCNKHDEDINVYYKRFTLDAKSILGVLSCDFRYPMEVEILTEDNHVQDSFYKDMEALSCTKTK